jgi:fermentation-respiration switch protein FrsA (DUF1100 family)
MVLLVPACTAVENALVFHPRPALRQDQAPPPPIQDLYLPIGDGSEIHARWAPHPNAKGAILFCHGNGGNVELWGGAVRQLWENTQESVLIFDYPGYGNSQGKPNEEGCYAAARAAHQWLVEKQKVPPERIILYGESLGGAVAVDLAAKSPHRALVLVRTFTSVPEVGDDQVPILPCSSIMTNKFNSLEKIGQCRQPIFLAHADKDRMISMRHAHRLMAACTSPVEFCLLRNMGHNDPLPAEYYAALRQFLGKNP